MILMHIYPKVVLTVSKHPAIFAVIVAKTGFLFKEHLSMHINIVRSHGLSEVLNVSRRSSHTQFFCWMGRDPDGKCSTAGAQLQEK